MDPREYDIITVRSAKSTKVLHYNVVIYEHNMTRGISTVATRDGFKTEQDAIDYALTMI